MFSYMSIYLKYIISFIIGGLMKELFTSTKKEHLAIKFLFLYIFNLLDMLFTQFLLFKAPDLFMECNPFLLPVISDISGLLIKIIIPIIVFIYWFYRLLSSSEKEKRLSGNVLNIGIIAYLCVNLLHCFNMFIYISSLNIH